MATPIKTGMVMIKIVIGIIAVIFLAYGLATGGFWEAFPFGSIPDATIEKVLASEEDPGTAVRDENPAKDDSIFAWPTIISLNLAIIGIIAFRRNTYH
jgi:hypothetical protein